MKNKVGSHIEKILAVKRCFVTLFLTQKSKTPFNPFLSEKQKYGLVHKTGVGENQIEIVCLCTTVVVAYCCP